MASSLNDAVVAKGDSVESIANDGDFEPSSTDTQDLPALMDAWLTHEMNQFSKPPSSKQQTPGALDAESLKSNGREAVMSLNRNLLIFHGFKQVGLQLVLHAMPAATQSIASTVTVAVSNPGMASHIAGAAKDVAKDAAGAAGNFAAGFALAIVGGTSNFACKQMMKVAVPEPITEFARLIREQKATVDARCQQDKWFEFCEFKKTCSAVRCREGDLVRLKTKWLGTTSEAKTVTKTMVETGIVCDPSQFLGMQDWKGNGFFDGGMCECLNTEISTKYNASPDYEAGFKAGYEAGKIAARSEIEID